MSENENLKRAEKELEYLTGDEETKRLAYLREKAIRDEMAAMAKAKREGKEEGIKQEKLKNAKQMLKEGIDIHVVAKITNLTIEELQVL